MITFFRELLGRIFPWYSGGTIDDTDILRIVANTGGWQTTQRLIDQTHLEEDVLLDSLWHLRDHKRIQTKRVTFGGRVVNKWKLTKAGQRYLENLD